MSLVVTGATGQLGRQVVESLLARGVPAGEIVAGGRRLDRLADLAARGVRTTRMDYDDPDGLVQAFGGADRLLLVSGPELGKRVQQHTLALNAAARAGVGLVAYTSAPYAASTSMQLAVEHRATEEQIRTLGVPFTFLRNGWYFENYTAQIPTYLAHGAVVGSAGQGRISGAPRAEYAEAAAAVLATDGHENAIYELGGDDSFTLADLAAVVAERSGTPVSYQDVSVEQLTQILLGAGLPEPVATVLADVDRAIRAGELEIRSGDLSRLIGRPTTSLEVAVKESVAALPG